MSAPLSDNARRLRGILRDIRGRENAVLGRDLALRMGIEGASGTKRVCDAARELRLEGTPVGSCSEGYYWITDYAEALAVLNYHLKRGRAHFTTAAGFRRHFPSLPPIEQVRMEV